MILLVNKLSDLKTVALLSLLFAAFAFIVIKLGINSPEFVAKWVNAGVFVDCSTPAHRNNPVCDRSKKFSSRSKPKLSERIEITTFNLN